MNKPSTKLFAFYGTLRQGQGNHRWSVAQDNGAKFDGTHTIHGYRMHSLGGYPFVVKTDNLDDSVVVELYELTDDTIASQIHRMELGAGYHTQEIVQNEKSYLIYVQNDRGSANYPIVPNGDWVKYVEARRKEREAKVREL